MRPEEYHDITENRINQGSVFIKGEKEKIRRDSDVS